MSGFINKLAPDGVQAFEIWCVLFLYFKNFPATTVVSIILIVSKQYVTLR